jgi:hypothetical protein
MRLKHAHREAKVKRAKPVLRGGNCVIISVVFILLLWGLMVFRNINFGDRIIIQYPSDPALFGGAAATNSVPGDTSVIGEVLEQSRIQVDEVPNKSAKDVSISSNSIRCGFSF